MFNYFCSRIIIFFSNYYSLNYFCLCFVIIITYPDTDSQKYPNNKIISFKSVSYSTCQCELHHRNVDSLTFVSNRTSVQSLVCHSGHRSMFADVSEVTAQQGGTPSKANRPFK